MFEPSPWKSKISGAGFDGSYDVGDRQQVLAVGAVDGELLGGDAGRGRLPASAAGPVGRAGDDTGDHHGRDGHHGGRRGEDECSSGCAWRVSIGRARQGNVKLGWWVVGNLRPDQGEHEHEHRRHLRRSALARPRRPTRSGFPYEVFRELRDNDPVSHHDHPGWERGYWAVTRHADVQRVSRDWNGFQNAPNPFLPDDADFGDEAARRS